MQESIDFPKEDEQLTTFQL